MSDFSTSQPGIDSQVVWIRLPGLPEGYYSECLLQVIGQSVGPMVKLDAHTDGGHRGRFARPAVCVDLRKPLVSKIGTNGHLQWVEYEALQNICFKCSMVVHDLDQCLGTSMAGMKTSMNATMTKQPSGLDKTVVDEAFCSWMVVERRKGRGRSTKDGSNGMPEFLLEAHVFRHWEGRRMMERT